MVWWNKSKDDEDEQQYEDEQAAGDEQVDETEEQEPKPEEAPDEIKRVAPDLASVWGDLTAEQRVRMVSQRLAQAGDSKANESGEAADHRKAEQGSQSSSPSAPTLPQIDTQKLQKELVDGGMDERAAVELSTTMGQLREYLNGLGQLTVGSLAESRQQLDQMMGQMRGLTVPQQLQQMVDGGSIKGIDAADIPMAQQLLSSGEVKSPEVALRAAAAERLASGETRKTKAVRASQQGRSRSRKGSVVLGDITADPASLRDAMEAEERG